MTQLRYRFLTDAQKDYICNGCGGKGGLIPVPEFVFHDQCQHHDLNYYIGCREKDRLRADRQFYKSMLLHIRTLNCNHAKKTLYRVLAWTYYRAVRQFGDNYFYYAEREKSFEDMIREINIMMLNEMNRKNESQLAFIENADNSEIKRRSTLAIFECRPCNEKNKIEGVSGI